MATTLYLTSTVADTHLGTDNLRLTVSGTAIGWTSRALSLSRGSGVVATDNTATVGATGAPIQIGGVAAEWISPPVAADVTISGTMTFNLWLSESNMSANIFASVFVDIIRANATATRNSNTLVNIALPESGVEAPVTTRGVQNFTTSGPGIAVNRGDRLRVRINHGTLAVAAYTWNVGYNGTSAAADGDTYVTFTENFSFESAPGGSVLYLTNTASDVATASVDREAWTSRGAGVQTDVVNTAAGWTAPIQLSDTAGGTVVDWFTKQLTAFTLTGMAVANIRALESNAAANASLRCQVAQVNSDGTSPTVWADWAIAPTSTDNGELTTSEVARTANVSGDDLAFTDGQRIRVRLYAEDISSAAMATAQTVTVYYAGTSGGASGDSYITLPQTVSEYVSSTPGPASMRRQRRASRYLTFR